MIGLVRGAYNWLRKPFSKRLKPADPALAEWFAGGSTTASGAHVTEDSSLSLVSVCACVRILAETIGSLPLFVYRRLDPRGKEVARKHPLFRLLHRKPNPVMTSFVFRETMMGHLALRGNAYAEKIYDSAGEVIALWPLRPDRVEPVLYRGKLYYDLDIPGEPTRLRVDGQRILHLKGFGGDGISGYSPIKLAKEAVGLAMACEESGSRLFGNGSAPGGLLIHPGKLSSDAKKGIKESWEMVHGGLSNKHRVAVLAEGMSWQAVGIPPEDAQFLQTRRFQLAEIARLFRVPMHLLQDLENASYATVEQQGIDFAVHSIRPWAARIEQELLLQLFTEQDQEDFFPEHKIDALLRGDIASRYSAYATGRQWGWLSIDDIRELENMNPLPEGRGGDYVQPLNMQAIPAGGLANVEPVSTPQIGDDQAPRTSVEDEDEAPRTPVED